MVSLVFALIFLFTVYRIRQHAGAMSKIRYRPSLPGVNICATDVVISGEVERLDEQAETSERG